MQNSLFWLSALAYAASFLGLLHYLRQTEDKRPQIRARIVSCAVIAIAVNGAALYSSSGSVLSLSQSMLGLLSIAAFTAVAIFILVSLFRSTLTLGVLVLPLAILAALAGPLLNATTNAIAGAESLSLHLVFAALTFALLSLAAAQALIIMMQEKQLKGISTNHSKWLNSLPPLQSMDSQLFQFLLIGFIGLLLSLYLGISSNNIIHGQSLVLSHHTVLTLLAAISFAALLIGRTLFGWRGKKAAKFTLVAYAIFIIGYFGTRFVRELLLS